MNGKLRTGKLETFNKLIDWLNNNTNFTRLIKYSVDNSSLLSNAWFVGFFSCDGYFYIGVRTKNPQNPNSRDGVKVYLEVSQSQIHVQSGISSKSFMSRIVIE